jgi:hypothetical protein
MSLWAYHQKFFRSRRSTPLILLALFLTFAMGCSSSGGGGSSSDTTGAGGTPQGALSFSSVDVPITDEDKRAVQASDSVTIGDDTYAIGWNTLMRSGDVIGSVTFGLVNDQDGKPGGGK